MICFIPSKYIAHSEIGGKTSRGGERKREEEEGESEREREERERDR